MREAVTYIIDIMENIEQLDIRLDCFLRLWKEFTLFYKNKAFDKVEDLAACEAVLKEISSNFPSEFIHAYLFGKISEQMLSRAEEFDNNLFHVRLIALNFDRDKKEVAKVLFRKVESFLAFCAKVKAQQEGKWEE